MLNKTIRLKLYSYGLQSLGLREYRRGWLKGHCPDCGRVDKFGMNLYQNRTNCFVCGYHPSPIRMVMEREGLDSYNDVQRYLKTYEGREYLEPVVERVEKVDAVLPDGYRSLLLGDGRLGKEARKYVKGRGFDVDDMGYKGWGYGTEGDYFGYIIIPFYIGGKLIYYNARRYMGGGPKYRNPAIEDFGIGKSLIMYNIDALGLYTTVYLVEGAINAETIGDQGIATGGKKISHYQISMILKSDVKNVIILLDPDAIKDAIKVGLDMAYHKKLKLIELPEDHDVNDLGQKLTLEYVEEASWLTYNDLLKMKNET
jgi:DNA primase